jgi:hypothetical protein
MSNDDARASDARLDGDAVDLSSGRLGAVDLTSAYRT